MATEIAPMRTAVLSGVRGALARELRFPPGIDVGREFMLDRVAEEALRAMEQVMDVPWLEGCTPCGGAGRVPCGCHAGCPATNPCPVCKGRGQVPTLKEQQAVAREQVREACRLSPIGPVM